MSALNMLPAHTALLAIDLQASNLERQLAPHTANQVLERNLRLADALRACGGTIIWIRVDANALLSLPADKPVGRPAGAPPLPSQACELAPPLHEHASDIHVTKRNWGALYGTELDLLLRRRQIKTLILSGIATNFGVESSARAAFDHGYELVFAEDAMSSIAADMHQFATTRIFPHMGRVRSTAELIDALGSDTSK